MNTTERRYWGFRIDINNIEFLAAELEEGRLRQGWGWDPKQDLRNAHKEGFVDEGAGRNLRMFNEVKKGHILLVPELPDWGYVAVVKATEDWDIGYKFEISNKGDYGHIFPAKFERYFVRNNQHVDGDIRTTLKARNRFWSMDWYGCSIEKIRRAPKEELGGVIEHTDRMKGAIANAFRQVEDKFNDEVWGRIQRGARAEEWETILVEVLQEIYPHCDVERTGGPKESEHGTDILMRIPSPFSRQQYGVAIQVKDYADSFDTNTVVQQIKKADCWEKKENLKIIEKVVIVSQSERADIPELSDGATSIDGVEFVVADELKNILSMYAKKHIGKQGDEGRG